MLQGKEETKKWWREYCSSHYNNTGNSDRLNSLTGANYTPPIEDVTRDILYEEVETAQFSQFLAVFKMPKLSV